jgi:hypothetical protein
MPFWIAIKGGFPFVVSVGIFTRIEYIRILSDTKGVPPSRLKDLSGITSPVPAGNQKSQKGAYIARNK